MDLLNLNRIIVNGVQSPGGYTSTGDAATLGKAIKNLSGEPFVATSGGSGATQAINFSYGNIATVNLVNSKANAITISPPPMPGIYVVILKQDGTGSCTISSWDGGTAVVWAGGSAPTLTTTASYVDIVTLLYDGTTLRGTSTLNFAS